MTVLLAQHYAGMMEGAGTFTIWPSKSLIAKEALEQSLLRDVWNPSGITVSKNAICSYFIQMKQAKPFGRRLAGHHDRIYKWCPKNYKNRQPGRDGLSRSRTSRRVFYTLNEADIPPCWRNSAAAPLLRKMREKYQLFQGDQIISQVVRLFQVLRDECQTGESKPIAMANARFSAWILSGPRVPMK